MEHTDPKIKIAAPKFEEFLEYDEKGNPVLLRRSASIAEKAPEVQFQAAPKPVQSFRATGSMRFFAGFEEVRARLQGKLAAS